MLSTMTGRGLMDKPTFFITYCDYAATGEGQTLMVVIATTQAHAHKKFITEFGDYFFTGQTTVEGLPPEFEKIVPSYIVKMFKDGRIPWLEYHQCHHFNLS